MSSLFSIHDVSRRVAQAIAEASSGGAFGDDEFTALALELFELQYNQIPVYQRLCQARGIQPAQVTSWSQIPALPTCAFKEFELTSLPAEQRTRVFLSSGTGARELRSRHYHSADSLRLYEASLIPWFSRHVLTGGLGLGVENRRLMALTPPARLAPESSLVHMFETIRATPGGTDVDFVGVVEPDGSWSVDLPQALRLLEQAVQQNQAVVLVGPAFSFVHLLDHLVAEGRPFQLPAGSRAMETGGYKGRSRTVEKGELRRLLETHLALTGTFLVSEYGMSELSSQAYDRVAGVSSHLEKSIGRSLGFRFPAWARARIVSPESGLEVADGQVGLIRVYDLANTYSLMAVQTEDLALRRGDAFELIGRAPAAGARGCSLMLN